MGRGIPLSQLWALGREHCKLPPSGVRGRAINDHVFAHLSIKSPFGGRKCSIFDDSAKAGFHESHQDGGNTLMKWENSDKSGKVVTSVCFES